MAGLGAPWPGAVAVSGGGDSLALMHLLHGWAKRSRIALPVVLTVDHGLQENSAKHARAVLRWARKLGLRAHMLRRTGEKPKGDIEAAAREARYHLMGAWCRKHGVQALYVGHTRDDQAETFLLRLARGSGLDGLAAMRPISAYPFAEFAELSVVRPLMAFDRDMLRTHLAAQSQEWIEDPMNGDPRFERVRIREALRVLDIPAARLADAAAHLGRAREALEAVTEAVLRRACRPDGNAILVEAAALTSAPREVGLRALARLLMAVSGQPYRPRFERLERLFDRIAEDRLGGGCTLHGCKITQAPAARAGFGGFMLVISPETGRKLRTTTS
jgi:tRNA(Ile)-lysidine synthase